MDGDEGEECAANTGFKMYEVNLHRFLVERMRHEYQLQMEYFISAQQIN